MAKPQASVYSLHPGFAREAAFAANLEVRTGKTLEQWVALVKAEGPDGAKDRRAWLKDRGLTTQYAMWVADVAAGGYRHGAEAYDPEAYVEAMFSGPKAGLRPIYDALLALGLGLGPDMKACPCQTIVPLYRHHVIAQIKPTTRTRIDLGFALRDTPCTGRLIDTGGFAKKDRITHRIPIASLDEIDAEVRRWLRAAYDLDA